MTTLNSVDIENGRVDVAEYSKTEAALAELRARYVNLPDASTPAGYDFIKSGLKEVVGYRTSLEAKRKEIKAPYLKAGKLIDSEAARITAELIKIEEPMKAAKKAVDDREKREREERIARLQKKVDAIKAFPARARGQDSGAISKLIDECGEIDTSHDFYDLTTEAIKAQDEAMELLGEMYSERLQYEQAEEERRAAEAKLAEERAQMERERADMRRQQQEIERQKAAQQHQPHVDVAQEASKTITEPTPSPMKRAAPETPKAPIHWERLEFWCNQQGISGTARDDLFGIVSEMVAEIREAA